MMYADVVCLEQMTRDIEKFYGKLVGTSRSTEPRTRYFGLTVLPLAQLARSM
jgi:hypothetical protein